MIALSDMANDTREAYCVAANPGLPGTSNRRSATAHVLQGCAPNIKNELQPASGRSLGRDRLAHLRCQLTVLLRQLQIELALAAVGGELGNQLAFGGERLRNRTN